MSTCLTCPPLSCNMHCEASKQLFPSLTCAAQTSYPQSAMIEGTFAFAPAATGRRHVVAKIDLLPNELKSNILEYLEPDLESIRNIRLISKSWAFLGAPYLLSPVFTALSCRDDFNRLVEVARHPYFSHQIKTLNIRWMPIDEESLRLTLIAPYGGFDYDEENFRTSWGQVRKMKGLIDLYSDTFCNEELLKFAFKNLPQLTEMNVSGECYLFETHPLNTYLYDAFKFTDYKQDKGFEDYRNCYNILSALTITCPPNLTTLKWNPFSHMFWHEPGHLMLHQLLAAVSRNLRCLHLTVDWFKARHETFPITINQHEILGMCLSNAKELRELYIGGDRTHRLIPALPESLKGTVFPHLHTVELRECDWPLSAMQELLWDHRSTLRRVRLESHAAMQSVTWDKDMSALLDMMKDEMNLEKLDCRGLTGGRRGTQLALDMLDMLGRENDGLWDENWQQLNNSPKGHSMRVMALRIEDYVLRNAPYPDWIFRTSELGRFGSIGTQFDF